MNRSATWILVFSIAAAFFGWETYKAWTGPALSGDEPPPAEAFAPPVVAAPPEAGPGDAAYPGVSSIVARPVFRPDRRPYQEAGAAVAQRNYEAELSRLTILGVLMTGMERKAVVVSNAPGRSERWEVTAGDTLSGFTVKEVSSDGLILAADGREFTLPLYAGGPKAGGGPMRTEAAPASPPAIPSAPPAAKSATVPGRFQPPAADDPSAESRPFRAPTPQPPAGTTPGLPSRTYPRYYVPGRR